MNTGKTAFYHLRNIAKIRNCLSQDNAETLVHAFISSKLDFCNALLYGCLPQSVIDRLQYVQNCTAQLVTRTRSSEHITPVLHRLRWLPVRQWITYKILLLMYTCQLFVRYRREIFILGVLQFLKTTPSFPKIPEEVWSLPKVKLSRKCLSTKSEIVRKVLSFIHFTHGFRSLHASELTYFWKFCQAKGQQLTFFNQAWEIGPLVWAGVRSKFSTCRRETHAYGVRVGRYTYVQSTEWHGTKIYSRSPSALYSYEAITIFLKKSACNSKV